MMRILFLLLIAINCGSISAQDSTIRVMSYNIRLLHQGDGINYWEHRRPHLTALIRYHNADIIGVQEAFRRQLDDMISDLPEYTWTGVCRTDGSRVPDPDGEFSAIFYRKDRFEALEGNTFWLSSTPDLAGSVGWDAALPRIVTWMKFRDKLSDQLFYHFNTHFDHIGEEARSESALLLLKKIKQISGKNPVILTGDFNCTETESPYKSLTDNTKAFHLQDAFYTAARPHYGPVSTFAPDFMITGLTDRRIDFIFVQRHISVKKHAILSDSYTGRLPSDHLPVFAEIIIHSP